MKTVAFVLYPGITALDLVGPLQVMSVLAAFDPSWNVVVAAETARPAPTDTPLGLVPSHTFDQLAGPAAPYAVIVPGGTEPTFAALADDRLLERIRTLAAGAQVIGSVCTGSLLLAAAGLLQGRRATTHWAVLDVLGRLGAVPVAERVVQDGPVVTAAGVSAGIDMALALAGRLAGEETARTVQLMIEYDPQPPYGPIDWAAVDRASLVPVMTGMLAAALADHPRLRERLTA
ncbi:DJ-1/PfpI family protein [Planomonospora venezuelensis]|uniref:Transcriptional regulator GlxA family with amidase domain n=1 Tax=Planomonospora venezuelensis TaxID=1999 RepID=A0A841DB76_PLAVE|nr:DJ-1/PfpI family protein [Planomonospora venezuelensis]MBB5967902.1 transcriptional regulator GlxA family with amidase domain [Planomonospora venezuelensis]GIN05525.1 thiazole biosynthesis protein ThiJ [Planomonospora venezuelensis]